MVKDLGIVGIGASAGGLKAITELFSNMANDTGLAFIVIQHLSPDFKSLMDELLAKHTSMPIQVIKGDTKVEANTIYLISSKSNIIIKEGIIKNVDRKPTSVLNLPIDIFFHSLGEDAKEKSIGVILSGTGTDGSRGICTIKEKGGVIFVQDPINAQFDGMPNAAITTNMVDSILSPTEIGVKISNFINNTGKDEKNLLDIKEMTDLELFKRILELVEKESNVNFMDYRQNTLVRRLEKRMYLNQTQNINEYYNILLKEKNEVIALFNEFLIGVTRFFRDQEAFNILKTDVIPSIFGLKNDKDQLRVWCVGCSSGEEAYSTAILLSEYLENHPSRKSYKIFATDIDKNAIKKAGIGVYPESIVSDVGNDYLERYFVRINSGYRIKKSIRDNLVFTVHDALRDPPFINIDILICRNMLIYLNPKIQKKLLLNFRFALNYHACLFLGPSESISSIKRAFNPINVRWNIFKHVSKEKPLPFSREKVVKLLEKPQNTSLKNISTHSNAVDYTGNYQFEDFIAQEISQRYGPRSLFVDDKLNIIYINGDFKDILQFPRTFADLNLLSMLNSEEHLLFKNGVRRALQDKEPSVYKNVQIKRGKNVIEMDVQFFLFSNHEINISLAWIKFDIKNFGKQNEGDETKKIIKFDDYKSEKLSSMKYELNQVKREKQYLIEQLEAANEELQSSNEELLAANEELQSTNEELQSVNEELYTVNTELQSKINELIISNNDVTNLLKSTDIGIIFLDKELRIRKFTPALKDQFELEESDIGRPISNFTNSFSQDINSEIRSVLINGLPIEREIKDQNDNSFLMRLLPYWTNEEELDGVVISFINLNEIKAARKAIDENANKYEAIFNHTNNVIMTLEKDGTIISINTDDEYVLHPKETVGTKFYEVPGSERQVRFDALSKLIENRKPTPYESSFDSAKGKKWYEGTLVPILQEDEVHSIILIAYDVTHYKLIEGELKNKSDDLEKELFLRNEDLEKANSELQEVNSYLDSFVHGAAHDLRAPLAQMKGMVNLLPKIVSKEQTDKVLDQFKKGVEHMDNTLSGLIELIEFQKNTAEMIAPVDLVQVFEEVKEQLTKELEEVEAEIETDFQYTGVINYIPAYIKSIFYNLMTNAIKYRNYAEQLKIEIAINKGEKFYEIKVKDNGIGMDLNRYDHLLFKPFKRLTAERTGMGIGLSIINSAIKKAGGRIDVASQLGKGATFTVYLLPMEQS